MKRTARQARILFFAKHSGYGMVAAKSLADAEEWREAMEEAGRLTVTWEHDQDADLSWADAETLDNIARGIWHVSGCVVTLDGEHVASLWGIVRGYGDPYMTVVEAELCSQAMAEPHQQSLPVA